MDFFLDLPLQIKMYMLAMLLSVPVLMFLLIPMLGQMYDNIGGCIDRGLCKIAGGIKRFLFR